MASHQASLHQSLSSIQKSQIIFKQCLLRDGLVIPDVNKKMMSFRGQANWTKMTSPGGKLRALACHLTKKVNKAEG
jgi:hypothetical protein